MLILAFPPFNLSAIAFVALVPLIVLWSRLSWARALWWGWFAGIILFFALMFWTSLTVFDFVGAWSVVALILLAAIEGLAVAATAVVASLVGRGRYSVASIFAIPAAWLLFEAVRTQGSLGMPFGELGLIAAHVPLLLPLASFGGVYLLTAVIGLTNAALAAALNGSKRQRAAGGIALAGVVIVVATANVANHPMAAPSLVRVAVAQGNVEQRVKWESDSFDQAQAAYAELTREAAARGANVVVWPETAIATSAPQDPALLDHLKSLATANHVWILAGTLDSPTPAGYYNALIDLAPDGSIGGIYHKRWLVPFAEYLPFENLLRRLPLMDKASSFLRGPGPNALPAAGLSWGPLICYESAFAPYARATANAGADVIVVATDDAWFDHTPEPYQHFDASVIQAAATGRWIVRAAATGISAIIDPHGTIVTQLGLHQRGVIVASVGRGYATPYDRYGEAWLLYACLITVSLSLLRAFVRSGG